MVLDECWKPIYFGIKKSKVTSHKNIASVGLLGLPKSFAILTYLLPRRDVVRGNQSYQTRVGFLFFRKISQKPMQLGSPKT